MSYCDRITGRAGMTTVTRITTIELEDGSDNTLEVEASVGVEDRVICVESIDSIIFHDNHLNIDRDWDLDFGIGAAIEPWVREVVEDDFADMAQEIDAEIADAVASQLADAELAWQREHREAS